MPFSCRRRRRRSARWAAGEGPAGCAGWPAGEPACRAGARLARAAVAGPKSPSAHTPPRPARAPRARPPSLLFTPRCSLAPAPPRLLAFVRAEPAASGSERSSASCGVGGGEAGGARPGARRPPLAAPLHPLHKEGSPRRLGCKRGALGGRSGLEARRAAVPEARALARES